MQSTDKDNFFILFICVYPVHLRLNSLNLKPYPAKNGSLAPNQPVSAMAFLGNRDFA